MFSCTKAAGLVISNRFKQPLNLTCFKVIKIRFQIFEGSRAQLHSTHTRHYPKIQSPVEKKWTEITYFIIISMLFSFLHHSNAKYIEIYIYFLCVIKLWSNRYCDKVCVLFFLFCFFCVKYVYFFLDKSEMSQIFWYWTELPWFWAQNSDCWYWDLLRTCRNPVRN